MCGDHFFVTLKINADDYSSGVRMREREVIDWNNL
jgi:hypothetical protein